MRNFYKKPNKYKNQKVVANGVKYDSKKEATRCYELKLLQRAGEIKDLKTQITFVLLDGFYVIKNNKKSKQSNAKYIADFVYFENGKKIVEDLKSEATEKDSLYRLKRKLLLNSDNDFDIFREVITYRGGRRVIVEYRKIKGAK